MNNALFGKTKKILENTACKNVSFRKNYLVSKPNYHIAKFLIENLLATEMIKIQILMNKSLTLDWPVSELSKIVMYEFWCDYVRL